MAMAFVDDLFLSLTASPSFLPLFLAYHAGIVTLPNRGVGGGYEERHLWLML